MDDDFLRIFRMCLHSGFFLTYLESVCWKSINYSRRRHTRGNPQLECQTEPHCPKVMWHGYLLGLKLVKVMKIRNVFFVSMLLFGILGFFGISKAQGGMQVTAAEAAALAQSSNSEPFKEGFLVNFIVEGLVDHAGKMQVPFTAAPSKTITPKGDFRDQVWGQIELLKSSGNIVEFQIDRASSQVRMVVAGISTDTMMSRTLAVFKSGGISILQTQPRSNISGPNGWNQAKETNGKTDVTGNKETNGTLNGWTAPSVPSREAVIPGTVVHRIKVEGLDEAKSKIIHELLQNPAFVWFEFDLENKICITTMNYPEVYTQTKTQDMILEHLTNKTNLGE
jgi:hypothetical protein